MTDTREFRIAGRSEMIEPGWRWATKHEVVLHKSSVVSLLDGWDIAAIQGGWKIDGYRYGNKIMKHTKDDLGHRVVIRVLEQVKDIRVIRANENVPEHWRWATVSEVRDLKNQVTRLLGPWSIAKCWGGWKIDGSGYGNVIQRHNSNEGIGEIIIVRVEEIQPDGRRYADLHETCERGHSMHPFHGKPPRSNFKGR